MIEARFDDLTPGAERAFAMSGPVGVLEARRPEEVVGAIDAAEAAAMKARLAGFVARCRGSTVAGGAERSEVDPFLDLRWRGSRVRDERTRPSRLRQRPPVGDSLTPSVDRAAYDDAIARIQARATGRNVQVNHTLRLRADRRRRPRPCRTSRSPGARLRRFLDTGRRRVLSSSPAVLPTGRTHVTTRPMRHAPRPLARRGRDVSRRARRLAKAGPRTR
jgi:hypothetical protein